MILVDLFCGSGGLSLGFEQAGFEVVAAIDNSEDAILTYNKNRKFKVGQVDDIKNFNKIRLKEIVNNNLITGVIGGPPCQGFSSARLSDNGPEIQRLNDDRNENYFLLI